ncbi:unnamed protein product [Pleuronectes platessa]|uniref:Uncharacterized protein n=1 Tax=Pleuronectes platessa TaxID=8262 RepID=A0A9N7YL84_PLEPL|nr:unnamed protein product [Pleuronectes platessa]
MYMQPPTMAAQLQLNFTHNPPDYRMHDTEWHSTDRSDFYQTFLLWHNNTNSMGRPQSRPLLRRATTDQCPERRSHQKLTGSPKSRKDHQPSRSTSHERHIYRPKQNKERRRGGEMSQAAEEA